MIQYSSDFELYPSISSYTFPRAAKELPVKIPKHFLDLFCYDEYTRKNKELEVVVRGINFYLKDRYSGRIDVFCKHRLDEEELEFVSKIIKKSCNIIPDQNYAVRYMSDGDWCEDEPLRQPEIDWTRKDLELKEQR